MKSGFGFRSKAYCGSIARLNSCFVLFFLQFCAGDIMSFQKLCNSGLATDVYGTVLMENQTIRDLVTIYIYYLTEKVNEQSLDLT